MQPCLDITSRRLGHPRVGVQEEEAVCPGRRSARPHLPSPSRRRIDDPSSACPGHLQGAVRRPSVRDDDLNGNLEGPEVVEEGGEPRLFIQGGDDDRNARVAHDASVSEARRFLIKATIATTVTATVRPNTGHVSLW